MLLLQFSTSHYCRKARLALGYKQLAYQVQNLTPGLHALRLKPITGTTTLPVLLPELPGHPVAIADSTRILAFLETLQPIPPLLPDDPQLQRRARILEDWLDESIGTATRFVYYHFRANEGRYLDTSPFNRLVIQVVCRQYGIYPATVSLARDRLDQALAFLADQWQAPYLVGDRLSIADITAAALLSPLALIPSYRQQYSWLWERIIHIHSHCGEALPPGLES
ncbi:MAG: glutathione S-transferase family protein [Cyanobacteria bacterium]|nr:glutathione S-transferase family protein [Cyanobacteriota bacterium]MDW8202936.1 glutathione S-transferase family protein [Cyanobacteriota bacterium SKYGB_h_bin112]